MRAWQVIVASLTLGGLLITYFALWPQVSVSVGQTRDPKLPFEYHFIVQNDSAYSIYSVHYNCEEWQMSGPLGSIFPQVRAGLDTKDEIESHGSYSVYCGGNWFGQYVPSYPPDDIARTLDHGILNIHVHFLAPLWPKEIVKAFGFSLTRDKDGNVVWLPMGKPVLVIGKPL